MLGFDEIQKNSPYFTSIGLNKNMQETVHLILLGWQNKEIAERLNIDIKTVAFRIGKINKILSTKNKLEIALRICEMVRKQRSLTCLKKQTIR